MRLSKLHIAGFKSFPDRSELGFDDGVTAIVGPNGCGKSNVVDAITWVLGEQSAKSLRGERMEDVIFNGSEGRKPTAAAEVRLKFSQVAAVQAPAAPAPMPAEPLLDDQPVVVRDVEIGRRLFRSGESEYLIDGSVCRLRDIHDLLMDSGLGVKAYSVIEQGKIGQILSSRPAERRMLIEEAAGVTKYKSRRRAAELKLEAAEQNLTRVDDIVFEVEKQRAALKRQAARARRYRRLREELRQWEHVQFARRYDALSAELAQLDARLSADRTREAAASARVADLESAQARRRLELTEAEAAVVAEREAVHAHELGIGRREQHIAFDRQQVDELTRQRRVSLDEAVALEARRSPIESALAAQRAITADAQVTLGAARGRVTDAEGEYARTLEAVQGVERVADETRAAVLAASATLSALSQARDHASAARDRVAAERERLDLEARELEAEAARRRTEAAEALRALDVARETRDRIAQSRAAAERALQDLRTERDRLQGEATTRERELAGLEARLGSLEDLVHQRASFGDGARFLLAEAGEALPHRGAVADHLIVERTYERAVDALLSDLLQHVVVERADDVARALALMEGRKSGRCGFAVLEDGSSAAPDLRPMVVPPGARALSDVVRPTGPDADRLARLLPSALIVESFDVARALARSVSVPVVTTAGVVCRGAWLVEGGAHREARGILETRAQIEALQDEIRVVSGRAAEVRSLVGDLGDRIARAVADLDALVREVHEREKAIVGLDADVVHLDEELARVARRLELVSTERSRASAEHETTDRRQADALAAIGTHEEQMRVAEEGLGVVMARLQAAREDADGRLRHVTSLRTEEATLIERAAGFGAELARLEQTLADLLVRADARRGEVDRIDARTAELRVAIDTNVRTLDGEAAALVGMRARLSEADDRISALRIQFGEREHDVRLARAEHDGARTAVLQSEVSHATTSAELGHVSAACVEALGLPIADVAVEAERLLASGTLVAPTTAPSEADDEGDSDAAAESPEVQASPAGEVAPTDATPAETLDPEEAIAGLRAKIDRLGPVNMMAIEQFDELEARHTFLVTQRKDLVDSIAQTTEAIRKIDTTTRERFADAFVVINRHFEQTFTTLFGGGRAGLVLIDAENDADSGIDIIAQPPGKRLQNVQLLSGGEKALTAMALMFAVFKHRPSPFCLLDEIDAPLDDANIGRFVEMLQGMQEHTQFILITHNRRTMEIADRLYGVTMEEPGVSRLISLQLN